MADILATETTELKDESPRPTVLENWEANERMRHVPTIGWMVAKVDGDLRRRLDILCAPLEMLFSDDPRRAAADAELKAVCAAFDRLADVARHTRGGGQPPHELTRHAVWSLNHAVGCMKTVDAELFGRRLPFQTFERSKAEPLYGALLRVLFELNRLVDVIREIDPDIDSRLLEGLVNLDPPMPEGPLVQP